MDGLHVVIGCETCEIMYDVCIYGVDGLDVVIGCETCETNNVYMEWMD